MSDGEGDPRPDSDLVVRASSELSTSSQSLAARVRSDLTRKPKARILVMEDEELLRGMFLEILRESGYEVHEASTVEDGLRLARELRPDLVHSDGSLPTPGDYIRVCRAIREDPITAHVGLIVCTGIGGDEYEAAAFDAGADEFLRKRDFKPKLYLNRVAAVLQRASGSGKPALEFGPLSIDPAQHEVLLNGTAIGFTPTELDILYRLVSDGERAWTRNELLDRGLANDDHVVDRTVDVHILAIRRKLGMYLWLVTTVWGVGYRLTPRVDWPEPPYWRYANIYS